MLNIIIGIIVSIYGLIDKLALVGTDNSVAMVLVGGGFVLMSLTKLRRRR